MQKNTGRFYNQLQNVVKNFYPNYHEIKIYSHNPFGPVSVCHNNIM